MGTQRIVAALLILCVGQASAEVYRWVDAQGKVHFGDRSSDEAESVEVGEPNKFSGDDAHEKNMRAKTNLEKQSAATQSRTASQQVGGHLPPQNIGPSPTDITQRIEECKRNRQTNCSDQRIRSELADEAYRKSGHGRQQQEAIRQRKQGGW